MNHFENLESSKVFHFFEEISKIPRCSGSEKEVSDYMVKFAKDRNLEVWQDEIYNIIIKKTATPGYENFPSIALQGHLDMVCEKNVNTIHDFSKDPIKLIIRYGMIYADGTTLGADNGIAVAMAMAVLDSNDLSHPCLEVILTVQEETGLTGAKMLDPEKVNSRTLINIDSEEEGKLLTSCAGGIRSKLDLPVEWTSLETEYDTYKLTVGGLSGGHSGAQINLGRGNAIKILGRVLREFSKDLKFEIFSVTAGSKDNVIPREASADIAINTDCFDKLNSLSQKWTEILRKEFVLKDEDVVVSVEKMGNDSNSVLNMKSKRDLIFMLNHHPNGINTMSAHIPGLVESSLNIGVLETSKRNISFHSALRSSIRTLKYEISEKLQLIADYTCSKLTLSNEYPEWSFNPDSKIRDLFVSCHSDLFGKEPEIIAIHAGVECGIFSEKFEDMDMISFGPDTFDPHSPDEHISIHSVDNCYKLLLDVLKSSGKLN
ncbi:aminoacyl-histidine dipeptidase [Proteocatella sphenisci]|uniref:aminoacyl-histidine dipeptidase n=1 Tax=Proteocatella sphenisci TaxID=181070 RepID=UPI00048B3549|nr:aminoacyl-histidine dipeptidase [Proteocatella sphenisci]